VKYIRLRTLFLIFKDVGLWLVWIPLSQILRYLPLNLLYKIGGSISWFFYLVAVNRRHIVVEELKMLFGERFSQERLRRIAKRSFKIYVKRQIENLVFGSLSDTGLNRIVSAEGFENLQQSVKKRKGVILLLAHFGSFLLPPAVLGFKGYRVHQVAGKPLIEKRRVIYRKIFESRKKQSDRMPFRFFQTDQYVGSIVRAVKNGDIVVIAFDGRTGSEMIPAPLLSRTAQFSPGPFKLAMKTGAFLLPTFIVRDGDDKHTMIFEKPMQLPMFENGEDTVRLNIVAFVKLFEEYLLKYPCHFGMTLFTSRNEAEHGLNPPLFLD